jgi:hypothetical protein
MIIVREEHIREYTSKKFRDLKSFLSFIKKTKILEIGIVGPEILSFGNRSGYAKVSGNSLKFEDGYGYIFKLDLNTIKDIVTSDTSENYQLHIITKKDAVIRITHVSDGSQDDNIPKFTMDRSGHINRIK